MIYLGQPYAHSDPTIMEYRYNTACRVTAQLLASGITVFSPIAHCHELAQRFKQLPREWSFWREHDFAILSRCSELRVLFLEGWEASRGLTEERAFAAASGIPIIFSYPEEFSWPE